jgi:hypothetical protein
MHLGGHASLCPPYENIGGPSGRRFVFCLVVAGLDPAIHPERCASSLLMDARVKPAHDEWSFEPSTVDDL